MEYGSPGASLLPDAYADTATPPLPKVKKPPRPTLQDLSKEFSSRRMVMGGRDQNVRKWRAIIRQSTEYAGRLKLSQLTNDAMDDRLVRLSRPATIGSEIRRHVGQLRAIYKLRAENNTEEAEQRARRNRAFLQEFFAVANDDYRRGGGPGSLAEGMTRYEYEDGSLWVCVMPAPERPSMPLRLEIYDSVSCVPVWSAGRMKRFYHCSQMSVEEIRERWGAHLFPGKDPDSLEEVIGFYDEYYLAVLSGAEGMDFLKAPVPHGIVDGDGNGVLPVAVFYQNGFTGDSGTVNHDSLEDIEANRGRSNIADHESELTELTKLVTARLSIAYREANPAMLAPEDPEGTEYRLSTLPGAHNKVPASVADKIRPMATVGNAAPALVQQGIDFFTQEIDNDVGTIAQKQIEYKSGTDRTTASEQAQKYFASVTEALREAHVWIATMALLIYKARNYPEVTVTEHSARSGWPYTSTFSPDDVPDHPRISVEFTETSRTGRMQVNAAMHQSVADGIATPLMMFEAMGVENPELEVQKLMEWRAMQHPAVIQSEGPFFALQNLEYLRDQAAERGNDDLAKLYDLEYRTQLGMAIQQKEIQLRQMQEQQKMLQMGMLPPMGMGGPPGGGPSPQGGPSVDGQIRQMAQQQGPQERPDANVGQLGVPPQIGSPETLTGSMSRLVPPGV